MGKVLILEDDMERMKYFKRMFMRHEIYHFEHAKDAIEELKKTKFQLICLDHDLGGQQMKWDDNDNGMMVAEFLEKHPYLQTCDVVVHSLNNVRGPLMAKIIPNSLYIPGFWLHRITY